MIDAEALEQDILTYIARELLDGRGAGLDRDTPLLEWGVLDSLSMMELIDHVHRTFRVEVPGDRVTAEHFKDVRAIVRMVLALAAGEGAAARP
ncbi:MAG: acyl carrier protein [Polyangiales bacterium]